MSRLARWCHHRRLAVLGIWLVALVALGSTALSVGSAFTDSTTMPDSESATSYRLLGQLGQSEKTAEGTGTIAWHSVDADVDSAGVRAEVTSVLEQIARIRGVEQVVTPYTPATARQLDPDGDVAFATVTLDGSADADAVRSAARSMAGPDLQVETGGRAFYEQPAASGLTEVIGIVAALVVLLLVFRSLWAALLPIVTGVAGVLTGLFLVMLASHAVDLAASTPTMGALIGLGVGIDYALFIVNRHRKALLRGADVGDALAEAVSTSGRAVVFAGLTVVVALLGMVVVEMDILTGMARAAAVTVVMTVLSATTLLPALLSLLGLRVLSRQQRRLLTAGGPAAPVPAPTTRAPMGRWAVFVEDHPRVLAAAGIAVMLLLALPAVDLRLGSSDASSDPSDTSTARYYSMMSGSFGDGFDAALLVVGDTPDAASRQAFAGMVADLATVRDVASATQAPTPAGSPVSVASVVPDGSAQQESTAELVHRLRDDVIPRAERGSDLQVYVGGATASGIDLASGITDRLPTYLVLIAVLGFLLLAMAFRSILVPLIGALANLLTLLVGLGTVSAVFGRGWGTGLLGVGTAAPIESIVPVLVLGVMFGLAMDYQVFLVSRMHEEWNHQRDNRLAVRVGLRETGPVILTAAIIMVCVFASFGFGGQRIIAEIGVGLAVAILVDAFVVRMTVVPALMHLLGARNWSYPTFLDRITPHISVEGPSTSVTATHGTPQPATPGHAG